MNKAYPEKKILMDIQHDMYGGQKKIWNLRRSRKRSVNENLFGKLSTDELKNNVKVYIWKQIITLITPIATSFNKRSSEERTRVGSRN